MAGVNLGGISESKIGISWDHGWMRLLANKSLASCQAIDILCHKLSQNGHFVIKFPRLVATILQPRFFCPCGPEMPADPEFGPRPEHISPVWMCNQTKLNATPKDPLKRMASKTLCTAIHLFRFEHINVATFCYSQSRRDVTRFNPPLVRALREKIVHIRLKAPNLTQR